MANNNRSNVLLVEILIAVLFFMLSATVLVRVFVAAREMTMKSEIATEALTEAQNVAETLYAAENEEAELERQGFLKSHGVWTKDCGEYSLYVSGTVVSMDAGEMWQGEVCAYYSQRSAGSGVEEICALKSTRYREVQR